MKNLQYDKIIPATYEPRYEIDWEKGERKYRSPCRGIRVYEHGEIVVLSSGYRDPAWRNYVAGHYGLKFCLLQDMTYAKFFTSEGIRVPKSLIGDGVYLYERGRIYSCNSGSPISFYSEYAQPSPENYVRFSYRNRAKEKARLIELTTCFALGETLTQVKGPLGYDLTYSTRKILTEGLPTNLRSVDAQIFCHNLASHRKEAIQFIINACKDRFSHPYLIVKE